MKILLATDGSEYSTAAAETLCYVFGGLLGSDIRIVSVYEPMQPIAAEPFAVSAEYYNEISEASRNQAESFAAAAVDLVKERCPEAKISHEVLSGKPAPQIVQLAEQMGCRHDSCRISRTRILGTPARFGIERGRAPCAVHGNGGPKICRIRITRSEPLC